MTQLITSADIMQGTYSIMLNLTTAPRPDVSYMRDHEIFAFT